MRLPFKGLWLHADFVRLWSGQTISVLGSTVGITAMTFTAILSLHATAFQMGLLNFMRITPGFLASLVAGVWVDRLRRRPLLIGADLGRALMLSLIPLAASAGVLRLWQVYVVTLVVSILTLLFDIAYESYLPRLISKEDLLEGNSKLSASAAVAEFGGFSIAGWLVQALSAPIAIFVDAASFGVSALSIGLIRGREAPVEPGAQGNIRREIGEGLKAVWQIPLLRASALVTLIFGLACGVSGALIVLYMSRNLGFSPGILAMIWAVGGISSFIGAALAPRLANRLNPGRTMLIGLSVFAVLTFCVPLASGPTLVSALLLIAQQLGDGFCVIHNILQLNLRQTIAAERVLGRVNAVIQFAFLSATLAGSLLGGWLGEAGGVRLALVIGSSLSVLSALVLAASPLRNYKGEPTSPSDRNETADQRRCSLQAQQR
jgi:predicted MFS family arabinose efflux permease